MPIKIDGRLVDGRYKKGVDTGAMSKLKLPLPIKDKFKPIKSLEYVPKHDVIEEKLTISLFYQSKNT
jgi:hypothetical protein